MTEPANSLPDKVMGPVDHKHFDEHVFDSVTFHGVLFRNCTFNAVTFQNCMLSTVRFENCLLLHPRFEETTVEHIALLDTEVISPVHPLDGDWFDRISGSTLTDVVLRQGGFHNEIVEHTTIIGHLEDVSFMEHHTKTQLAEVDLSQCTLTNVSFIGVPMQRVKLSEHDQRFVDENWIQTAEELRQLTLSYFDDDNSRKRKAAEQLFNIIEADASNFRSKYDVARPDLENLGYDERRGARYLDELSDTTKPEWIREPIAELYAEIGWTPSSPTR
nr:Uncharacterized protein conserved in bacteria [Streptococcus thermophilus]